MKKYSIFVAANEDVIRSDENAMKWLFRSNIPPFFLYLRLKPYKNSQSPVRDASTKIGLLFPKFLSVVETLLFQRIVIRNF